MELDDQWKTRILELAVLPRDETLLVEEFIALVDAAEGRCTPDVIRTLLKTYYDDPPDNGTQETVERVLASADQNEVISARLDELARLVVDAPEWADAMIAHEIEFRPQMLSNIAASKPEITKKILRDMLSREDFQEYKHIHIID